MATAATMGTIALPEMKRFKYNDALATGCVAAGGTLGILIPPSTVMIIYGILTEQPIGTLFIAGILPGILLSGLFMHDHLSHDPDSIRRWDRPARRYRLREKIVSLKGHLGNLFPVLC